MRAQLTFELGDRITKVSLPSAYTVGRDPSCDLVLDHRFVSNLHCTFMLEPHGVAVFDHESSNGTLVNGVRVRGKALLRSGDVIEVGPHLLTLVLVADALTSGAATAQRPAMMMNLGVQRSTFTDQVAVTVRPVLEIVETQRDPRASFRDVVKAKDLSIIAIAGDLESRETPGAVLAELRRTVRAVSATGSSLSAIGLALDGALQRLGCAASLLLVRLEPATGSLTFSGTHAAPSIVRKGRVHRLEGEGAQNETSMLIGDVLVVPSAAVARVLAAAPEVETAFLVKESRSQIVSIWLANELSKTSEDGCAVCVEILGA
jgi:hypothetical protein